MLQRTLLLLTTLAFSCACRAQHPGDTSRNTAIKLSNQMVWQTFNRHTSNFVNTFYTIHTETDWLQPAIAVQRRARNGHYHEVEISGVTWRTTDHKEQVQVPGSPQALTTSGYRQRNVGLNLRYEYIFVFDRKKPTRIKAAMGVAAGPYVQHYNFSPYTTSMYPASHTVVGMRFFVVPRFTFAISKRVFADANIPICFADAYGSFARSYSPTLPAVEQRTSTANFEAAPGYFSFRLGFGVVL